MLAASQQQVAAVSFCHSCRELTPLGHLRNFVYQGAQDIYAPDAKVLLPGDSLTVQVCCVHVHVHACLAGLLLGWQLGS